MRYLTHFLTYILLVIPTQLIGYLVLAVTLLFYLRDERVASDELSDQRLPKILSWWDNGDDWDRKCGLNGDLAFQAQFLLGGECPNFRLLQNCIDHYENTTKWTIYRMRYTWLALRNPVNGFKRRFLGFKRQDIAHAVTLDEKPEITGQKVGDWTSPGTRKIEVKLKGGSTKWEYYKIVLLPRFLWTKTKAKCIRIRLGYKIDALKVENPKPFISWVLVVQPWKTYKGKIPQ